MSVCECGCAPIYRGQGGWECAECRHEYDEEGFNTKTLVLRDRRIADLEAQCAAMREAANKLAFEHCKDCGNFGSDGYIVSYDHQLCRACDFQPAKQAMQLALSSDAGREYAERLRKAEDGYRSFLEEAAIQAIAAADAEVDRDFYLLAIRGLCCALDDAEGELRKAEEWNRKMVEKAADKSLDGYRELAQRAADAENERDQLRAELEQCKKDAVGDLPHSLQSCLVFAARYAHSRPTGAAHVVVNAILGNWLRLSPETQAQILREATAEAATNPDDWKRLIAEQEQPK